MKIKPFHFVIFWLVLNIVQGFFTELTSDEGYYWFYSKVPQWGYYDHPPFLAWSIAAGYGIIKSEFGVRIFSILLNGFALLLFFKMASAYIKNQWIVFVLLLSMPLLNYLSFIVFPDGPLLLFTLIFLLAYKRFLKKDDWLSSVCMGIALAFMFYSKYHALLVLIFTILSNLRLLRSSGFYFSLSIAFILFLPHLVWQYQNGFPSVKYHLSGRLSAFSTAYVFQYVSQQVLAIGPALLVVPFVYKTTNQFEKTLKFIVLGTFIFLLIASLRTFIHFHWTSIAIFPLLFLSVRFYSNANRLKLLMWLTPPFLVLVLVGRLQLLIPVIPVNHVNLDYYHGRKLWANQIAALASGDTVLFQDNFREASLFSFYSEKVGAAVSSELNRKSQYDLWHYEDSLQHKNALYIRDQPFDQANELTTAIGKKIYYTNIADIQSYFNIEMKASCITPQDSADFISICLEIRNCRGEPLIFKNDGDGNSPFLYYKVVRKNNVLCRQRIAVLTDCLLPLETSKRIVTQIPVGNLKVGRYKIIFGFQFGKLKESENDEIVIKL